MVIEIVNAELKEHPQMLKVFVDGEWWLTFLPEALDVVINIPDADVLKITTVGHKDKKILNSLQNYEKINPPR